MPPSDFFVLTCVVVSFSSVHCLVKYGFVYRRVIFTGDSKSKCSCHRPCLAIIYFEVDQIQMLLLPPSVSCYKKYIFFGYFLSFCVIQPQFSGILGHGDMVI